MYGKNLILILLEIFIIISWKKDVLLLADVFEKFLFTSLKNYNLDLSHYFSAPGLSWDAMFKMSKVELENISDPDIFLLKRKWEEVLVMFQKDIVKQITNIVLIMMTKNLKNILLTLIWIIYMDMQWVNIYRMEELNGLKVLMKQLIEY